MTIYQKVDGVWVAATRPYVHRNGVWTAGTGAWVKRSGSWVQAYEYDVTPPNPPEITLNVHEDFDTVNGVKTLKTRYIRVGVRLPGGDDEDARLVRVLTTYEGNPPTSQFGGTYTQASDSTFPNEPWSEWRYHSYGPHSDTSEYAYKQWPRNATAGTIIKGDTTYHFGGWALDRNGNWSVATQSQIHVAKAGVNMPNTLIKEARFQPNTSGSWRSTGWVSGNPIQQNSPRSRGLWLYGGQITDSIGAQTSKDESVVIRSAQIFIKREDDGGTADANIYLFWHGYPTVASLPAPEENLVKSEVTKIGTLAKGQGKWFELPNVFKADLNKNIKGFGLDYKDPVKASAFPEDYSSIVSTTTNLRCGELHVVWEEEL